MRLLDTIGALPVLEHAHHADRSDPETDDRNEEVIHVVEAPVWFVAVEALEEVETRISPGEFCRSVCLRHIRPHQIDNFRHALR